MNKVFSYRNLDNLLQKLKEQNIDIIEIELGISMETPYYNKKLFKDLCQNIKKYFFTNGCYISNSKGDRFKIKKFKILLADSINHHNIYYRLASKYIKDNSLSSEKDIPIKKIKELQEISKIESKKQGQYWFSKNLNALNKLFPNNSKLDKNFKIDKTIITLFQGDKDTPEIELISYDYYVYHKEYKATEKALNYICDLKNSKINKTFQYEVDYFIKRLKNRDIKIENEDLLRRQSYKYLFDEDVSYIIKHREQNNLAELYFGGNEPQITTIFRNPKIQSDPIIKKLMQKGQPLEGADQRKFVSVKLIEEE